MARRAWPGALSVAWWGDGAGGGHPADKVLLCKGFGCTDERAFDMMVSVLARLPGHPLDRLTEAVDELAHRSIDDLSTHALGGELVAIRRQIDRLEAQFIRRTRRFDSQKGALAENLPSTVSWLRATCGLSGIAAAERVRMARALEQLPLADASLGAGRAPFGNVALIARLAETVGNEATRPVEQALVAAAEKVDTGRMSRLVMYTQHCIDSEGVLDRDRLNHERRWFSCDRTFGGGFLLRGQLDAEGGALLKTAIDASSLRRGPDDDRNGGQRRADALVDLAAAALRSGTLPSVHGQRPHLVLTASLETLQGVPGAPPAVVRGVGPVNLETARRLACDASLRVAVAGDHPATAAGAQRVTPSVAGATVASDGAVDRSYSIGRASRTVPPAMRTAIGMRDQGCRYPGCDRPPEWTDGHHIEHWADRGDTHVSNVVSMCRFHHRVVHEQRQQITLHADGSVTVSPRGARDPTGGDG